MPEGPELHLASRLVNKVCKDRLFSGKVVKSDVAIKNPEVEWDVKCYRITALSRGKELKLTLNEHFKDAKKDVKNKPMCLSIVFRFGMSGCFKFDKVSEMHKHAHLNFFTATDDMVLSYVDVRRFGSWVPDGDWSTERGPCVLFDYDAFRKNVLSNLDKAAFARPICETLLNQKYFNGVGNYLRAEVLYRLKIPPFVEARSVLEKLENRDGKVDEKTLNTADPDIIDMCTILAREVVNMGATGYTGEESEDSASGFMDWLQCYYQPGMSNLADHNKRTIWFHGPPGPLVPIEGRSRHVKKRKKTSKKKDAESENEESPNKKVKQEEGTKSKRRSRVKREVKTEDVKPDRRLKVKTEIKSEEPEELNGHESNTVPVTGRRSRRLQAQVKEETVDDGVKKAMKGRRKVNNTRTPSLQARTVQKQSSRSRLKSAKGRTPSSSRTSDRSKVSSKTSTPQPGRTTRNSKK